MKTARQDFETVSPQRRRFLKAGIGGGAATALPAGAMAALSSTSINAQNWVLSGLVRHGPTSEALAGARVEVWSTAGSVASIHTDRDGRFALAIDRKDAGPQGLDGLKYWVSHRDHGSFAAGLGGVSRVDNALTSLQVGAAGRLYANVGIALA